MKEEKIMILNMLQEGRISVEEAVKLLDSVQGYSWGFSENDKSMEEKLSKFTQSVDGFAKDFCAKVESAFKDVEPKLKKASAKVVEKTANAVDQVSKSLNETLENLKKYEEKCESDDDCEEIKDDEENDSNEENNADEESKEN